jgi:hypothetical protein
MVPKTKVVLDSCCVNSLKNPALVTFNDNKLRWTLVSVLYDWLLVRFDAKESSKIDNTIAHNENK